MRPFHTVLVANRGEIALRIMRTCRRMGLRTVAVFSDADSAAPFVRFADEAVRLGPAPSRDSYLNIDAVLRAAKLTGADAVHPGYGFLSENPAFAEACVAAGLVFIGPTAQAIRAMGLKREAKDLVGARGVPLVPGFDGGDQTTATLKKKALELGLPVIFKPSAGGGGKGMKIARSESELDECIESGRREAQSSFGDGTLIIEQYLERPRHIEVQVLADEHGNTVHLFERECSIQRRHQKIIEETPSTALSPERRAQMGRAAVEVAKAVNYANAGTVEFIVNQRGEFFFSEMNTRLQVEHRVTELVTGLDLVEQQLRIARGEKLAFAQGDLAQRGHAVQCRLYAEDPQHDFAPSVGALTDWHAPEHEDVLIDSAVEAGGEVSVHYDPMIAKLISWGETREEATAKLVRSLESLSAQGPTTNRVFLTRVLTHPAYSRGELHTAFIAEHLQGGRDSGPTATQRDEAMAAAICADHERRRDTTTTPAGIPSGWRNNRAFDQRVSFSVGEDQLRVEYRVSGAEFLIRQGDRETTYTLISHRAPEVVLQSEAGVRRTYRVTRAADRHFVHSASFDVTLTELPRFPPPADASVRGGLMAPMPGKVVKLFVSQGQTVKRGEKLLVLEAMKMEQTTTSVADGVVKQVLVREGEQVTAGQLLVVLEE